MARNNTTPLRFQLPDGDQVDLCTWEYIESLLEIKLTPMLESLNAQQTDLKRIDTKIASWITTSND